MQPDQFLVRNNIQNMAKLLHFLQEITVSKHIM